MEGYNFGAEKGPGLQVETMMRARDYFQTMTIPNPLIVNNMRQLFS